MAAGRIMTILRSQSVAAISVEKASVYGAALVLPQIARSAGWPLRYAALAIRGYIGMVLNVFLQAYLLYMISQAERILDRFSGQMHLCDFGALMDRCEDPTSANCVGPGGTRYTPARIYSWSLWNTRVYAQDSFLDIFPEHEDFIHKTVDPGEYGLESYHLRVLCCFVVIVVLWDELGKSVDILEMLWYVPTAAESWVTYETRDAKTKEEMKRMGGMSELDFVKFRVAGMPLKWKLINLFFVWLPKTYLWFVTLHVSMLFVLETSTIDDMILRAVAMGFILSIDELLATVVTDYVASHVLTMIEDYYPFEDESDSDATCHEKNEKGKSWGLFTWALYRHSVSVGILGPILVNMIFVLAYYEENCVQLDDGSRVSQTVLTPIQEHLSVLNFLFAPFPHVFPVVETNQTLWEMPSDE